MKYASNGSMVHFRSGDHICLFYRSRQELLVTLGSYIRLGLEHNERCFCVQSAAIRADLIADLQSAGMDVDRLIERGSLILLDPEQVYFECGRFDPDVMTKLLAASIRQAVQEGFSGFRATGDMRWAVSDKPGCDRLVEYEALMERFYPGKPALGLCTYPVESFSAAKLEKVLEVHRFALLEDHPAAQQRTLRIRNGKFFGDVAFSGGENELFHCVIQQKLGGEILSWTHERSLGDAISSIQRQLHDLSQTA